MLNFISWPQYLLIAAFLLLVWYIYVVLRHYRTEFLSMLRPEGFPKDHPSLVNQRQASVIGPAQPDTDTALNDPEELFFGAGTSDDISDSTVPTGPADEFLAEAEILIDAFHETDDKSGFLSLLNVLVGKYTIHSEEIDLESLLIPLKDRATTQLPFQLSDMEWPATWPEA